MFSFVDEETDFELLNIPPAFVSHSYDSIWIKVKVKIGADRIIENVYRLNSAPRADLGKTINVHNDILESFQNDREYSN